MNIILGLLLALTLAGSPASAEAAATPPPFAEALRSAVTSYSPSEAKAAKQQAADAFFEFERSALDRDLAARDPALYRELENEWMRLLETMDGKSDGSEVRGEGEKVLRLLERGTRSAEAGGSIFVDSMLIILREGFEALLVVSALAAYLRRVGEKSRVPYLYGGAAVAVGASVLLWIVARTFVVLGGSGREALEGWTILLATAVLFWVSYWLVSKAEADRWQAFVKSRIERAVSRGALVGLAFLSFVVVFREGFETVLFYEAVAARAQGGADQSLLVGGFATGCAALTVLYAVFQTVGARIPLRAFFNVTGAFLYWMAFRFAGAGVRELQEATVIGQTPVWLVPESPTLSAWTGIFPYAEPLALQAVLVILAVFAFFHTLRGGRRAPQPAVVTEEEPSRAVAARR